MMKYLNLELIRTIRKLTFIPSCVGNIIESMERHVILVYRLTVIGLN